MSSTKPLTICDSWWMRDQPIRQQFERLSGQHSTDVLVIGAGITGLSTAIELAERGRRVTVCEAEAIGAGTTAGSSGHLDAHPEMGPKALIHSLGIEKAEKYTMLRQEAIDTIENRSAGRADFVRVPAFYYSENPDDSATLHEELEAARQIGLSAVWFDEIPIVRAKCGYQIQNFARFDCLKYLRRLTELAVDRGVKIFEKTLVEGPTDPHPVSLAANQGRIEFQHVVCATHCSFTKSKLLYAATPPYQSYVLAAEVRRPPSDALFWDNSDPYYYVRRFGPSSEALILVGGCDHRTGMGDSLEAIRCIEDWTCERFDVVDIKARWSAELFEPTDGLPMIGLAPGKENIWVATGFSGVGLTVGTAAAKLLAAAITGEPVELEDALSPRRAGLSTQWVSEQAQATANIAQRVLPAKEVAPEQLDDGEGCVGTIGGKHVAVCRDLDGREHRHDPVCPHLGGVVHWNEAEQTWDCPLHGGRFTADGQRIYGPPESGLNSV